MMRQIPAKIWLPVIAAIIIAVGLAVFFTWPEEKAPEVIAPEVTPPQGIVWNVQEKVEQRTEKEIQRVVNVYLLPDSQTLLEKGEVISINHLNVEGEWAIISYGTQYKESGEPVPAGGAMLLLHKTNENWKAAAPREGQFCQWLPSVPETLMHSESKEFYQMLCIE